MPPIVFCSNQIFNESIIVWKVLPVVIIHYSYLYYLLAHQISTILNGGQIVKKRSVVTAASDWSTELPPHLDHHLDIIIIQFQMLPREMFETWRIIK